VEPNNYSLSSDRGGKMLRETLKVIAVVLLGICMMQAATLHRSPLSSAPSINAWKDDSSAAGIDIRYDGTNISSSDPHYYDGHRGTDFAAPYGTAVYVSASGPIYMTYTTCPPNGGYLGNGCGFGFGNFVAIKHSDNMVSVVAHLSSVTVSSLVSVACFSGPGGNLLGYSGNSGDSSGAHLHFELRINDLSAASMSYDPFGGSFSTQTFDYWYSTTLVADPLHPGSSMRYPLTTCAP
jgi:murein DD-endopeptidase MepM/ murein hydrolase activator NlpD